MRPIPDRLIRIGDAKRLDLGSQATSNERSIFQFIHADGRADLPARRRHDQLAPGSVWNTMPCHVHDRRMEAYLYFDLAARRAGLPPDGRAGRDAPSRGAPTRRRSSRPAGRSIRAPAPPNYTFIWAMAGDNVDYTDVDPVAMETCGDRPFAFSLEGRRVVVTGANTGIGQGIAVGGARPAAA
jgi:4-deoxy-L-threo-5-hexosulose-uronate ketol-isomerase